MRRANIPVSKVALLSKVKLFEEKALPFFKDGRNRITFRNDYTYIVQYWLKDIISITNFCSVNSGGNISYNYIGISSLFVRPCFTIKIKE